MLLVLFIDGYLVSGVDDDMCWIGKMDKVIFCLFIMLNVNDVLFVGLMIFD